MKKSSLVLLSLSLLSVSFAANTFADEVVKTFPAGGAKEILENPSNPGKANEDIGGNAGGAIKMKKSCKASDGKITFEGDSAYEKCSKEKLEKPKK